MMWWWGEGGHWETSGASRAGGGVVGVLYQDVETGEAHSRVAPASGLTRATPRLASGWASPPMGVVVSAMSEVGAAQTLRVSRDSLPMVVRPATPLRG